MAPVGAGVIERRGERRASGAGPRWCADAVLRPGQQVTLLNISSRAALVESASRLRPGARTEIHLSESQARPAIGLPTVALAKVGGRLDRCHVAALEPVRYRGVLFFDQHVDVDATP